MSALLNPMEVAQLMYAYLNGHPFVGTGRPGVVPHVTEEWAATGGSGPGPWRSRPNAIVESLLSEIALKAVIETLPEGAQKASLTNAIDSRIAQIIDDYCGTRPHYPGPWPWVSGFELAAGMSLFAASLSPSPLQSTISEVATRIAIKSAHSLSHFDGTVGGAKYEGTRGSQTVGMKTQ